jgi:hypothetical protein
MNLEEIRKEGFKAYHCGVGPDDLENLYVTFIDYDDQAQVNAFQEGWFNAHDNDNHGEKYRKQEDDRQKAVEEMVEFVTSNDRIMPWPCQWVTSDILVVVDLNYDNEPGIEVYRKDQLLAWHQRAKAFLEENNEDGFFGEGNVAFYSACFETKEAS